MAKDPAILWYWNDWNGGTSTFTRHLKGCYIDLLSSQFNSGRLSLLEIKTVLGADFGPTWPILQKKFRKDENDMYYNERMEEEKEKRKKFTDGRRKNLEGKAKHPHMDNHMASHIKDHVEIVIENDNAVDKDVGGSGEETIRLSPHGFFTDSLDKALVLTDVEIGSTIEYLRYTCKKVIDQREVVEQWEAFKIQQFSVHDWYNSWEKLIKHFRDSFKIQLKNGTKVNNGNHGIENLGTSGERIKAAKKF